MCDDENDVMIDLPLGWAVHSPKHQDPKYGQ